jgi:uncharacterized membrane protein
MSRSRFAFWSTRRAAGRLLIAVVLGVVAAIVAQPEPPVPWWVRAVVGWDVGALALNVLVWRLITHASPEETRRRASSDDPGHVVVWLAALGSSLVSLFSAIYVIQEVQAYPHRHLWQGLSLAAIALSWVLTHTAFTLRYAHLYYHGRTTGGLEFPGEEAPCDSDFAYFSFTIGMCFQVSDVQVTTARVRREVLLHALLSFIHNTVILALCLNVITGMLGAR